ncbi:MAG: deaminase [Candidatus Saccharimonadales bacterium]
MRRAVDSIETTKKIGVLNKKTIKTTLNKYDTIVMPDEDVSQLIIDKYLDRKKVKLISTFLRWDRQISTQDSEAPAHRQLSSQKLDVELMAKAVDEAQKSPDWWRQVGSLVTKGGTILLLAHNRPLVAKDYSSNTFGDPRSNFDAGEFIEVSKAIHSEAALIARAAHNGTALEGASLYVTTFPCPVCAKLVAEAGISKVYYTEGYSRLDAGDIFATYDIELIKVEL